MEDSISIGFIDNLILFRAMKKLWKSVKAWQSYGREYVAYFFLAHPVYGNSIAALTVERVELLKTIVGRWSGVHDRHSSRRHATGPAAAVADEHWPQWRRPLTIRACLMT